MYGLYVTYLQKRYCFRCSCIYSTLKCSSILRCSYFNKLPWLHSKVYHSSKLHYLGRVNIALSSCSSFATVRDFRFNPSLISMLLVNFRIFSLFCLYLWSATCWFLTQVLNLFFVSILQTWNNHLLILYWDNRLLLFCRHGCDLSLRSIGLVIM